MSKQQEIQYNSAVSVENRVVVSQKAKHRIIMTQQFHPYVCQVYIKRIRKRDSDISTFIAVLFPVTLFSSQKVETIQMSIYRWMDNKILYVYNIYTCIKGYI